MRDRRILARAGGIGGVLGGALITVCTVAGPALAATPDSWTDKPPMPWLEVLGIYAGIPIALFAIITVCVMMGSFLHGPRYRPGLSWWAEPQWFGGPTGGRAQLSSSPAAESSAGAERSTRGGASARW